jgi:hypothetical protein
VASGAGDLMEMNTGNVHRGACFCGAVQIEVVGDPIDMGYCHCASCRAYSGAPFVAFAIWPTQQVQVFGETGSYNKVGTSDRKFCLRCGGHFILEHPDMGVTDVRVAVLPGLTFEPKAHLFYAERVIDVPDGLPKYSDMPTEIGGTGACILE